MSYKLAAASSDGISVNQHFARSEQFVIFEVKDNGSWEGIETRKRVSGQEPGDHDEELHKTIDLIKDCSKVLVNQIGLGAEQLLQSKGITAYTVSDSIDHAVEKIIQFE